MHSFVCYLTAVCLMCRLCKIVASSESMTAIDELECSFTEGSYCVPF